MDAEIDEFVKKMLEADDWKKVFYSYEDKWRHSDYLDKTYFKLKMEAHDGNLVAIEIIFVWSQLELIYALNHGLDIEQKEIIELIVKLSEKDIKRIYDKLFDIMHDMISDNIRFDIDNYNTFNSIKEHLIILATELGARKKHEEDD